MPASSSQHVDKILLTLGPRGEYQILQTLVAFLAVFPVAFQVLSNVFISCSVPYQCAAPEDKEDLSLLVGEDLDFNVTYEDCDILVWTNDTVVRKTTCLFGVQYKLPVQASAVSQFDLVCDRSSLARLSQALVIAGQGVGAFVTTIISDRIGRKKVLVACNIALMVSGFVVAYSPNYIVFAIFKFITGACQQGVATSLATLTLELLPTKQRRLNITAFNLTWSLGTMLMALIAYLLREHSWRILQTVYSISSVFAFLQWWYLDESLRWLIANGKSDEANAIIRRAAKINKKDVECILQLTDHQSEAAVSGAVPDSSQDTLCTGTRIPHEATQKLTVLDLFRVRLLLKNAVIMWFAWFTTALGFFVLYLTSSTLSGNRFLNFFLTALMEVPATIILYLSLNRFGRKATAMGFFALLGVGLLAAGIFRHFEPQKDVFSQLILVSSLIAMLGASGSFIVVYIYTPEMFPTNLRSQAMGVSSCMGRIGGMLAPFTEVLAERAIWGPGLLIGCCACLVCVLFLFLPETNGRELPQTMEDFHRWLKVEEEEHNRTGRISNGAATCNGKSTKH